MKKILSLICLLMLAMTSAWATEVATYNLGTQKGVSTPDGFFKSVGEKWNWNTKFNGAEYDGISFSQGLKMEGSTKIGFTTEYVSTVTIVQSTWSANTIKLDDVELAVADAVEGTGCRIYTVTDVEAGDHVIGRGSGESGLFYVKVEWEAEKTVTFNNDANWEKVFVWAWNDTQNFTGDEWPGVELTPTVEGSYRWTTTGDPTKIIFSDGGSNQTADLDFKAGGEYNSTGRIITLIDYTATFKTDGMTEVWAYVWNGEEKPLGEWPGTKMEGGNGEFSITIKAEEAPKFIIFHNNAGAQTPDWDFEDGKAYEYNLNVYTATFTTDAAWENVYAYAWNGDGEDAVKLVGDFPGQQLEAADGVYTFTYSAFTKPEKILFTGGEGVGQTPDMEFTNGRAYKWNTTLAPLYALEASETAIPAGTTVEVKNGETVVATLTYGASDGADFAAPTARQNEEYAGFANYTGGNGVNGTATSGTFYTIKPVYDGTITVGVWLNGGKAFFIQEDGTSLEGFDGIKKDYGSSTAFTFAVKAGSEYKVYCTGSKLGFYGFDYTYQVPMPTFTATFTNTGEWDEVYAYTWSGEGETLVEQLGPWPGTPMTKAEATARAAMKVPAAEADKYTISFEAEAAPEHIIFNAGEGKAQTADITFVDAMDYEYEYTESDLMAEAKALAADEEAVAVGKLQAAISEALNTGNEDNLQAAVDQFKADNAPLETDLTTQFSALTDPANWVNAIGAGTMAYAGWAAPKVHVNGAEVALVESYSDGQDFKLKTGDVMYQDITGLTPGTYAIELFGAACLTAGRNGMTTDFAEGDDNSKVGAYLYAQSGDQTVKQYIPCLIEENMNNRGGEEAIPTAKLEGIVVGEDGTIRIGLAKELGLTNWHFVQLKSVIAQVLAKDLYATEKKNLDTQLFGAATLLDDEYNTEGREAFQAAVDEAEAVKENAKMYNIADLQAAIANLTDAVKAFDVANRYIFDGVAYIIDAESGKFMAAGHDYGTRGIVNEIGLDLTFKSNEDRTVDIDSRVNNGGNHFLGSNLYMDSSSWGWVLKYRGFGFYISDPASGQYINIDANDNLVLSSEPREWIIVTPDGVMETRLEELADATVDSPVDATFLLQDPNFNRNDERVSAWEWIPTDDAESNPSFWNNHNFNGGKDENRCAESYHAAFTVKQTVSGAPAGFYQLTAQGFYRQDDGYEGDAPAAPVFFANGVNGDVPALADNAINSMDLASDAFTNGDYTIEPITFEVTEDGMMYVGVTAAVTTQWVIWDNFQLKYFGTENPNPAPDVVKLANIAEFKAFEPAEDAESVTAELTLTDAKVTYINSTTTTDYDDDWNEIEVTNYQVVIEDASAAYAFENTGLEDLVKVGQTLNGTVTLNIAPKMYYGIVIGTTVTVVEKAIEAVDGEAVPTVITEENAAEWLEDYDWRYVRFEDATFNIEEGQMSFTPAIEGMETITINDSWGLIDEATVPESGAKVNVTGFYFTLYGMNIFQPVAIEKVPAEPKYYLVGTMNEWQADDKYLLTLNTEAGEGVEEYMITLDIPANSSMKVLDNLGNWYPATGPDFVVNDEGNFTVYFRPNADGDEFWFEGYIYCNYNGIPTGISSIFAEAVENGKVYNLQGQKVQKTQKGLYIINGKKQIVR